MTASKTVSKPILTNDVAELRKINSLQDAAAFLIASGVEIHSTKEYGDGFEVTDKKELVNKEFLILEWQLKKGDHGPMAVVHAVTVDGSKVIFVDGSTGVKEDLLRIEAASGATQGIHVPKGLTVSEYTFVDDSGNSTPAKTYYLS